MGVPYVFLLAELGDSVWFLEEFLWILKNLEGIGLLFEWEEEEEEEEE